MISKTAMSEFFHNLSMQAWSESDDAILIKFNAINKLNKSLNDLLTDEALAFETERVSRLVTFFDQPVFVSEEQTYNNRIEEDIVRNILNDEKMHFPTDADHINVPNTAEEIKQQSIHENKLFIETELKKKRKRL